MKHKRIGLVWLVLVCCMFGPHITGAEASEIWESRYLLAEAVAEVEQTGQTVRGVLFVRQPLREVWIYHFTGTIEGDVLEASHHSGHRFVGKLVNEREITGVVTTRTGTRLTITARKR